MKTSFRIGVFLIAFLISSALLIAQDINYIENNDEYVDAPVGDAAALNGGGSQAGGGAAAASWDRKDQFNCGWLNYGLSEPVYEQFSGESIFDEGKSITQMFTNVTWNHLNELGFQIPAAWSYGAELLYFASNSDNMYSGEGSVSGSSINMNLYMVSGSLRLFFLDPVKEFLHPYYGVGWGFIFGDLTTEQNLTGDHYYTTLNGLLAYQVMGVEFLIGARAGMMAEIKNMRASASTSNDPFDQGDGDSVDLTFDGVIMGLTGFYRF